MTTTDQNITVSGSVPEQESNPRTGENQPPQDGLCANPRCRKGPNGTVACSRVDGQSIAAHIVVLMSVVGTGQSLNRPRKLPASAVGMQSAAPILRGRGHTRPDTYPSDYLRPCRRSTKVRIVEILG